jgi:hypothetical protein
VLGPDGLSWFEELSRREAADTAILYALDLIEHDGEDVRDRPFLDRKAALSRLLRDTEAGILFNEHIVEDGLVVFAHACKRGAEGMVFKRVDGTYIGHCYGLPSCLPPNGSDRRQLCYALISPWQHESRCWNSIMSHGSDIRPTKAITTRRALLLAFPALYTSGLLP